MSFSKTFRLVPSFSLSLLCCAASYAQTPPARTAPQPPVAQAAGYHWRTLALRHAVPGDILALMHWNGPVTATAPAPFDLVPLTGFPAPSPPALPDGVRHIFALRSDNSLLVEATGEGFATVARLVNLLDRTPRQIKFSMALVAVPATRADLSPDMPAPQILPLLLAGESSVVSVPTETVTEGTTASVSVGVPVIAPVGRFRLAQAGPRPVGTGSPARCEFRLTPRVNADGTVTLNLTPSDAPLPRRWPAAPRTLRAGEMVVYEVTGATQVDGERLFLFFTPTVIADTVDAPDGGQTVSGQAVIVIP